MKQQVHDSFASSTLFHPKFWTFALAGNLRRVRPSPVNCRRCPMFALWAVLFRSMLSATRSPGFVLGAVVPWGSESLGNQLLASPNLENAPTLIAAVGEVAEEFQWDTGECAPPTNLVSTNPRINESLSQSASEPPSPKNPPPRFADSAESDHSAPLGIGRKFERLPNSRTSSRSTSHEWKQQIWKVQTQDVSRRRNLATRRLGRIGTYYPRSYWRTGQSWGS